MPLDVRNCYLYVRACFAIVENLAVEVLLGMYFSNRGICRIFPAPQKSCPMTFEVSGDSQINNDHKLNICRDYSVKRQQEPTGRRCTRRELHISQCAPEYNTRLYASDSTVCCQGAGLKTIETQRSIAERQRVIKVRGVMYIFRENPLYVYIVNMIGSADYLH